MKNLALFMIGFLLFSVFAVLSLNVAIAPPGSSVNGILNLKWKYSLFTPYTHTGDGMFFGSSPAIANLGVNNRGNEADLDLEIVTGSDEYANYYPEIPGYTYGIWRAFDSSGFVEWASDTQSDEARSSPNIIDIDGDGSLDIVAGTTSGWVVEAIERTGVFKWTFPSPPRRNGPFAWHSSPAVADLDPTVSGLEVVIGNTFQGFVYALDGDNRDGVNDGITADISWYPVPGGTEGKDWDVLWIYQTGGSIISTPAIGDVDKDGHLEVVIGSADGNIYCLNGKTGSLKWMYTTGGQVSASAGLADFDLDGDMEVVIGSTDGNVYFINGDENGNGIIDASEVTFFSTGGSIYSSAALGDVDGDGCIEVIVGSSNFNIYSFDYNPTSNTVVLNWFTATGGPVVSSPALANRASVGVYDKDWPMFRNNPKRDGFYGLALGELDVYVGSDDGYLYLLKGNTGAVIDRFQTFGPIHTSPSVADVDGDEHLEIAFYDWGSDWGYDDTFWLLRDTFSPSFYLNASPDQNTVAQGGYVTYDITATSYNNFADPITFDIFGLPPNTLSTFTPNPATPPPNGSVVTVLKVTTTIDTPPGECMLFIRGMSGAKERTITVALVTVTGSDFAVDASPSQIAIYPGQSADFSVSVTSLSDFSSPVTLTVSGAPSEALGSFSPNPVTPPLNGIGYSTLTVSTTSLTPLGTYNLYINGTNGNLVRRIPLLYRTLVVLSASSHNVAVTNVKPSKTVVGQGYSLNINVTAADQGDYAETFNIMAYANTTSIATQTITLTSGNSTTITFTWNTTGFAYGNYTLVGAADIVPGETDIADNNYTCTYSVHVGVPGDVSSSVPGVYDKKVDMKDVAYLVILFNTRPTSPNWNPNADVDNNSVVSMIDIAIAILNYNKHE